MKRINERSRLPVTFSFRSAGLAVTPAAVRYRIDCLSTGRVVRDWTAVPAAQSISIMVTPDENAILDEANRTERRMLTVVADPDTVQQYIDTIEWEVRNLQGVV